MAAAPKQVAVYSLAAVRAATQDFAPPGLIGEGGFASVYKGELAGDRVAVKRLKTEDGSAAAAEQLRSELQLAASVQSERVLPLLGMVRTRSGAQRPLPLGVQSDLDCILFRRTTTPSRARPASEILPPGHPFRSWTATSLASSRRFDAGRGPRSRPERRRTTAPVCGAAGAGGARLRRGPGGASRRADRP